MIISLLATKEENMDYNSVKDLKTAFADMQENESVVPVGHCVHFRLWVP